MSNLSLNKPALPAKRVATLRNPYAKFVGDFYAIRGARKDKDKRNALAKRAVRLGMPLSYAAEAAGLTATGLARLVK